MEPIVLSGTPYEQGYQHGKALHTEIRTIFEPRTAVRSHWNHVAVEKRLGQLQANLERLCPSLVEEMHGIADGASLPYSEIFLYNHIADIALINLFCTNVSFARTPDGPVIGKTNDVGKDAQGCHILFKRMEGSGLPLLWVTWPGTVWANCFINGAGLCYGGASVRKVVRDEQGISSNILLRIIADKAANVPEAVDMLQATPIMHNPINMTLADAEGNLVVVEKSPDTCAVRLPNDNGVLFTTNEFCTPVLCGTDDNDADFTLNSRNRFENLCRLTAIGEHSIERLKEILSDHHNPGGICQHGAQTLWTTVAYIAVPRTRTLYFACGRPCETEFMEFSLSPTPHFSGDGR